MKKAVLILLIGMVSFSACKKYDEGPLISLRSKENRLCRKWKLLELYIDGEQEEIFPCEVEFTKDGKYHSIAYSPYDTTEEYLNWKFENKKKDILIYGTAYTYQLNHFDTVTQQYVFDTIPYDNSINFRINKLTLKELWYDVDDTLFNKPSTFSYKFKSDE